MKLTEKEKKFYGRFGAVENNGEIYEYLSRALPNDDELFKLAYDRALKVLKSLCTKKDISYSTDTDLMLNDLLPSLKNENFETTMLSDFDYNNLREPTKLREYLDRKKRECSSYEELEILEMEFHNIVKDIGYYRPDYTFVGNMIKLEEYLDSFEVVYDILFDDFDERINPIKNGIFNSEEDVEKPEKIKELIERLIFLPKLNEIYFNALEESNNLTEYLRASKINEFKNDENFIQDLETIMRHDKKSSRYHYHGTQDLETAKKIMQEGLLIAMDGLSSTSYSEFTMEQLLLYKRGFLGEIGSSGIIIIDQPIRDGKLVDIVEPIKDSEQYSFVPSGLQGLNVEPTKIVKPEYVVGYVDKINKKVINNPLYYKNEKKVNITARDLRKIAFGQDRINGEEYALATSIIERNLEVKEKDNSIDK